MPTSHLSRAISESYNANRTNALQFILVYVALSNICYIADLICISPLFPVTNMREVVRTGNFNFDGRAFGRGGLGRPGNYDEYLANTIPNIFPHG